MANFKPGQKVVCVDTNWDGYCASDPKLNEIVEIESIEQDGYLLLVGYGIHFKGFDKYQYSYEDIHFEPLVNVLQDHSDFDLWKIEQEIDKEQEVELKTVTIEEVENNRCKQYDYLV